MGRTGAVSVCLWVWFLFGGAGQSTLLKGYRLATHLSPGHLLCPEVQPPAGPALLRQSRGKPTSPFPEAWAAAIPRYLCHRLPWQGRLAGSPPRAWSGHGCLRGRRGSAKWRLGGREGRSRAGRGEERSFPARGLAGQPGARAPTALLALPPPLCLEESLRHGVGVGVL